MSCSALSWPAYNFQDHKRLSVTFRVTGGYWKVGTSSRNRVIGRIFTITIIDFIEANRIFFRMFFTKRQQKIVKTISAQPKIRYCFNFKTLKNELVTLSL
jgi:hypothetical protein